LKILDLDYQDLLFLHVTRAHTHAYKRTHTHKSAHKFAHIHDYIHIQANKGTPVHACVRERDMCVYVRVCVCDGVRVAVGVKVSVRVRVYQCV